MNCRSSPGSRLDSFVGNGAAYYTGKATLHEPAWATIRPIGTGRTLVTAANAETFANSTGHSGGATEGDHGLCDKGTTCAPHVDPQSGHEAVDFLRYLQESDGAEKPNQKVPGHGPLTLGIHSGLRLGICQGAGR